MSEERMVDESQPDVQASPASESVSMNIKAVFRKFPEGTSVQVRETMDRHLEEGTWG